MPEPAAKILIIDDDPDFVEATQVVLDASNYEVISASDGEEGLKKAKTEKPDLILLDVMMKHMTEGFHVSYALEKDPELSKTPIIMLSAIGVKTDMAFSPEKDGEYLPVQTFLDKPVEPDKLLAEIDRLLKEAKE